MPEEVGISCKMDYLFKFEYHVPYLDVGSENEICGTLMGIVDSDSKFNDPRLFCNINTPEDLIKYANEY